MNFILIVLINVFFMFSPYIYNTYQAVYLAQIQCSDTLIGLVTGMTYFVTIFLPLLFGIGADRMGRQKPFAVIGMALLMAGALIKMLFPNAIGFLMGNILIGAGNSGGAAIYMLLVDCYEKSKLTKAFAIFNCIGNGSILAAYLLATGMYSIWGMKMISAVSTITGAAGFLLCLFITENPKEADRSFDLTKFLILFKNRRFLFYNVLYALFGCVVAITVLTSLHMQQNGNGNLAIGIVSNLYVLFSTVFPMVLNRIMNGNKNRLMQILSLGIIGYCILCPVITDPGILCILQILVGTQSLLAIICQSEAVKAVPDNQRTTALSVNLGFNSIGAWIIPIIGGRITETSTMHMSFYFMAAICGIAVLLMGIYERKGK